MKEKSIKNGTLTLLLQKWTRKMVIFHLFGSVPGEKNAFSHHFPFQGANGNHFSHHFHSLLFVSLPNTQK